MDNIKKFEDFLGKMQGLLEEAKKQGHIIVRVEDLENAFPELMESDDKNKPNGGIVMEDFNEGNGFYKVNLTYLNEEQVKEIEGLVKKWNPELKESEDERIRKGIIELVKQSSEVLDKQNQNNMITWLEKQGEQPVNDTDEDIVEAVNNISILDMVESKFKVGDWIINKSHDICLITDIDLENSYYICESNRFGSTDGDIVLTDKAFHLWTIQDAKDGDVLCTYECGEPKIVFILKGVPKKHCALSYYCYYNIMYPHFDSDSKKGCLAPNDKDVKPATKEQRDLLFAKMKEAGYEWDAEKKELKMIVTPIFNIGDAIIKKNNSDINKFGQFTITDITGGKYWYNDRIICDISEQYEWELVEKKPMSFDTSTPVSYDDNPFGEKDYELHEATYFIPEGFRAEIEGDKVIIKRGGQKSAWSEEDEKVRKALKEAGYEWSEETHDLKKIEQNLDWDEEDKEMIDNIIDYMKPMPIFFESTKGKSGKEYTQKFVKNAINWLKSLKERIGG